MSSKLVVGYIMDAAIILQGNCVLKNLMFLYFG